MLAQSTKASFSIDRSDFIKDRKTFFILKVFYSRLIGPYLVVFFSGMLEINCAVKVVNCCRA